MTVIGPFNYSGGLNTKTDIFNQPPNTLSTLQNFRYWAGSLQERYMGSKINSSQMNGTGNFNVNGLFPNTISGNSAANFPFLANVDGHIYTVSPTGTTNDISNSNQFGSGGPGGGSVNSDTLNGIMVLGDNAASGFNLKWTGSGNVTKLTASADFQIVRTCNNFMFGITGLDSTLWWSNVSDPTTWNAASNITFRNLDGDILRDINYIGTNLYLFKNRSIGQLSTVTQSISGVVTLGPLTTVNVGIGTAGALCSDRLPDGRIVFWGSDAHAYIFDGSVITDISDQQGFGANCQALFDACTPATGASIGKVVVYPPRNEVWFCCSPSPLTASQAGTRVLTYDYKNNIWGNFQLVFVSSPQEGSAQSITYVSEYGGVALTPATVYGNSGSLITGSGGFVYAQDPTSLTGAIALLKWQTSINLGQIARGFMPRSMILPMVNSIASNLGTYSVSFAFDGGSFSSAYTLPISTSYQRVQIPISCPAGAFQTMQIKCASSATTMNGATFDPFYLSDEVLI